MNRLNRSGVISPLYTVFRINGVDKIFLNSYFQADKWHKFMFLNGDTGARADRFAIKDKTFFEMPILTPPQLEEQQAIGKFIDRISNLITLHQRKDERF